MTETNHWLDAKCAKAFWDQHKALPYQELLQDTVRWLEPKIGERWLDLGCGGGRLTAALWQASEGQLGEIISMDCAAVNQEAITKLRDRLTPTPAEEQMRFVTGNFSDGLPQMTADSLDGIVSGLAISYAESRDPVTGAYTDRAYNHLLAEMFRSLKPGGRLVFSVNVPEPRFWSILWKSVRLAVRVSKPAKVLWNAIKMQRYGHWLRREARRGRFHFFPLPEIVKRLQDAGFQDIKCRLSYAGQAYVIMGRKPESAAHRLRAAG